MIETSSRTRHYGRTRAVDDLSFAVRPGVVTGSSARTVLARPLIAAALLLRRDD